jgi:hypothetical protein
MVVNSNSSEEEEECADDCVQCAVDRDASGTDGGLCLLGGADGLSVLTSHNLCLKLVRLKAKWREQRHAHEISPFHRRLASLKLKWRELREPEERARRACLVAEMVGVDTPEFEEADNSEGEDYIPEEILEERADGTSVAYRVKWVGYPIHESTWEVLENISSNPEVIEVWLKKQEEPMKQTRSGRVLKRPRRSV